MTTLGEWARTPEFIPAAIASAIAVLGALLMVTRRDVVRGALWLVVTFIAVAVLFVTLGAELLAIAQVAVYAGAIMVLFLFVIILFAGGDEPKSLRKLGAEAWIATAAVAGLLALFIYCMPLDLGPVQTSQAPLPAMADHPRVIGEALFAPRNVLTVELIAVLLVVAMVGVILLAKGREAPMEPAGDNEGANDE
jgi:NADH-quinone oxidoreductase subunit J